MLTSDPTQLNMFIRPSIFAFNFQDRRMEEARYFDNKS